MRQKHLPFPAQLSSRPESLRHCGWEGGAFTTAYRPPTALVEGEIRSPNHLIMVTLQGGARRHEIRADGGHRFDGPDRPGSVSFLPATCARRLRLHAVEWRWATIALVPGPDPAVQALDGIGPFSGVQDIFVQGMLAEFDRLDALDGGLDPLWRASMVQALVTYLATRHARMGVTATEQGRHPLAAWQLRRVNDYIDGHLSAAVKIADLAALCRMSEGHFHRAFRLSTGTTPLQHVNARRVAFARQLLVTSDLTIGTVALRAGFLSPSHFARVFQAETGCLPSHYRRSQSVR